MSDELQLNRLQSRLIEVETALAFQQQLVEELNAAVLAQSRSLYQLESQVRALQEQLQTPKSANSATSSNKNAADEYELGE